MLANLSFKYKLMIAPTIALIGFGIFLTFVISVSHGNLGHIVRVCNEAFRDFVTELRAVASQFRV